MESTRFLNSNEELRRLLLSESRWAMDKLGVSTMEGFVVYPYNIDRTIFLRAMYPTLWPKTPREERTALILKEIKKCESSPLVVSTDTDDIKAYVEFSNGAKVMFSAGWFQGPKEPQRISAFFGSRRNVELLDKLLAEVDAACQTVYVRTTSYTDIPVSPVEWADMILDRNTSGLIQRDFSSFLSQKSWFKQNKLPYRRGYLFCGDPGNGKTLMIRAMLTAANKKPGFKAYTQRKLHGEHAEDQFEEMFRSASEHEYSMIILEDIDRNFSSRGESREAERMSIGFSVFLNCLDGIGNTEGMVIVATANHPKALDPAILQRPGRFDRVISFNAPSRDLILQFFLRLRPQFFTGKLEDNVREMEGMSYAQLTGNRYQKECGNKRRHFTLASAFEHARELKEIPNRYRENLQMYLCRFCGHWHVGHLPKRASKALINIALVEYETRIIGESEDGILTGLFSQSGALQAYLAHPDRGGSSDLPGLMGFKPGQLPAKAE